MLAAWETQCAWEMPHAWETQRALSQRPRPWWISKFFPSTWTPRNGKLGPSWLSYTAQGRRTLSTGGPCCCRSQPLRLSASVLGSVRFCPCSGLCLLVRSPGCVLSFYIYCRDAATGLWVFQRSDLPRIRQIADGLCRTTMQVSEGFIRASPLARGEKEGNKRRASLEHYHTVGTALVATHTFLLSLAPPGAGVWRHLGRAGRDGPDTSHTGKGSLPRGQAVHTAT